ncbi:MAG: MerR family transcriptional regulator [Chloroflexi bacterium]|nr:MerR family transcriptional regulator [Chloroflexota bacterium]
MPYTVKQLSKMAGVSARTLHYYDEIGLLAPPEYGGNGYRHYDEASLLRLQQILFYKELGLDLKQIKAILDRPDFNVLDSLKDHRQSLQKQVKRLNLLIHTVENTIQYLEGNTTMSQKKLFEGFSEEEEKQYEAEARQLYDPQVVDESWKRWKSMSKEQKQALGQRGEEIFAGVYDCMQQGHTPESAEAQRWMPALHDHFNVFYTCTLEIFRGLGDLYVNDPKFRATFTKIHPDLPEFLQKAMAFYTDQQMAK